MIYLPNIHKDLYYILFYIGIKYVSITPECHNLTCTIYFNENFITKYDNLSLYVDLVDNNTLVELLYQYERRLCTTNNSLKNAL